MRNEVDSYRLSQSSLAVHRVGMTFCWLVCLLLTVPAVAAAKIDQAWLNKLPAGKAIKVQGSLKQEGATAQGKAKITAKGQAINGKVVEIAAGSLKTGQIVMWKVENFTLASIHDNLDVFPLNEIKVPKALMVLVKGKNIPDYKVDQLPGELKVFAKKVLKGDDSLSFTEGLNLYGRIEPKRMGNNVKKAFGLLGADKEAVLLGGGIGNILTSPRAPSIDLYATLPAFRVPDALKKIFSGSQKPTLFISTNLGKTAGEDGKGGQAANVQFGLSSDVKLRFGKSDIDGVSKWLVTLESAGVGMKVAILKDRWRDVLGIKKLDLETVRVAVGLTATGSVTFGLRGSLMLGKKPQTLAVQAAINPVTGIDPSALLFYLKSREVSLEQFAEVVDIFVGGLGGNAAIAKKAKKPGLFKALQLSKLPPIELTGLKKGEDLEIFFSGPNASDPALGIGGLGARVKGRLNVWGSEIGRADANVTMLGLDIKGEADIHKIGPIEIPNSGMAVQIDAKAGLDGEPPHFRLNTMSELLGIKRQRDINFSASGIGLTEGIDLAGLGSLELNAHTTGKNLAKIKSFTVSGEVKQDLIAVGTDYILDGIKAAYDGVSDKTLKQIRKNVMANKDFFDVKKCTVSGTASVQGRDKLELVVVAMVAKKEQEVGMHLQGFNKAQVAEAMGDIFREFGSQLFAFKLPSFDKDLIRKRSDELYFYEGPNCTQEIVGTMPYDFGNGKATAIKAKKVAWFQNDEAKSLLVRKFQKGASIVLYDNPDGSLKDDVTVIKILADRKKGACIDSFEKSKIAKNGSYRVAVLHKNGIDGKVSRIKVSPKYDRSALPSDIIFYEGNQCKQGIKGIYDSDKKRVDECNDSKRCANDEIRSVRLMSWGDDPYEIYVYDRADGKKKDDWAKISVDPRKMTSGSVCVDTFEKDKSGKSVKVDYHKDNGLDGKISRIRVNP